MATFKAIVRTSYRREDGTYRIYIRVTHKRAQRYLPTPFYVTDKQITKGGKLKDAAIIDKLEEKIKELRNNANNIGFLGESLPIDHFIELLHNQAEDIDFFEFFKKHNEQIRKEGRTGTANVYDWALRSLQKFNNFKPLYASQITPEYMLNYYNSLSKLKANTKVMYIGDISAVYKRFQKQYNNNTASIIVARYGVFDLIDLPQKEKAKENVFKTPEEMQRIIDVPYTGKRRYDFAKDMFILSFVCFGTNMADWKIIEKSQYRDGILYYRRKKTARLSKDAVDIQIKVPEVGRIIINKYSQDKKYLIYMENRDECDYVSRFIHYFFQEAGFEKKTTAAELGIRKTEYSFYSNRHTMATIARNKCKVEYMTVNDMLNHSAPSAMQNTDTYLFKDFSDIWEANEKLLALFDWSFYLEQG